MGSKRGAKPPFVVRLTWRCPACRISLPAAEMTKHLDATHPRPEQGPHIKHQ